MSIRDGLPARTAPQLGRESDALRRIATLLGDTDSWDGAADYLDAIASAVHQAGLPHPGDDANIPLYQAVR